MSTVTVTHVRLSGGLDHQHVVRYRWADERGGAGESGRIQFVGWIENQHGVAQVAVGDDVLPVDVVAPDGALPYLRARDDQGWSDALLRLPTF